MSDLLTEVYDAQSGNSTLAGESLRRAGSEIAALAMERKLGVLAVGAAGERLVGAALLADERVRPLDVSCRLDGESVLLVAGHLAGPTGLATKAAFARALGASRVESVGVSFRDIEITGCDHVITLTQPRSRLVAL